VASDPPIRVLCYSGWWLTCWLPQFGYDASALFYVRVSCGQLVCCFGCCTSRECVLLCTGLPLHRPFKSLAKVSSWMNLHHLLDFRTVVSACPQGLQQYHSFISLRCPTSSNQAAASVIWILQTCACMLDFANSIHPGCEPVSSPQLVAVLMPQACVRCATLILR
jgi:hypothetical protein